MSPTVRGKELYVFRIYIVVWAVFLLLPVQAIAEEFVYDRILVKINDSIITQYDLDEEMKPVLEKLKGRKLSGAEKEKFEEFRKQTLERMVNDALLAQEIEKYKIDVSEEVVDKEMERLRESNGLTEEEFAQRIADDGLTMVQFREDLKGMIEKQELLAYKVHDKVLVTDSDIKEEYDSHKDEYVLDKMIELAILICPSDVSIKEVQKRITEEEMTFAEAVAKYSVGPAVDNGGLIGEVNWNDLADEWKQALEGVEEGGLSSPVTARGKDALLSPVKIMADRMVPLEEVRDTIFERLMQEKREAAFDEYFEKLKESAVIIYMDKQ